MARQTISRSEQQRVGFNDNSRMTLEDLIIALRMRLSEPTPGTWGIVEYTEDELEIDELSRHINEGQVQVARDLYERDFAFFEDEDDIEIIPRAEKYILPPNFMAIESVFHYRGIEKCRLTEATIKSVKEMYPNTAQYRGSRGFSRFYEIRGSESSPNPVYSWQYESEDASDDTFALIGGTVDEFEIRLRDTVENETDGSSGTIVELVNDTTIRVDGLSGGRTNTFEYLDTICVYASERPYETIQIYPPVNEVSETTLYEGSPHKICVIEPCFDGDEIRVEFDINEFPEGIHPKRSRIYLTIQHEGEIVALGGLTEALKIGQNEATLIVEEDMVVTNEYVLFAFTNDESITFYPNNVGLHKSNEEDVLRIMFTRLPRPLYELHDLCELPLMFTPAVVTYAEAMADQKKADRDGLDPSIYSKYKLDIEDGLKFLRNRGESGVYNIFKDNIRNRRRRFTDNGFLIPEGYTDIVFF